MLIDNVTNEELGNLEEGQQNDTHDGDDNPISQEELEGPDEQQPNQPLNTPPEPNVAGQSYRDTRRVSPRANEASDPNDTNTGGIPAGGVKGTSQT